MDGGQASSGLIGAVRRQSAIVRDALRVEGANGIARYALRSASGLVQECLGRPLADRARRRRAGWTFEFQGKTYAYFIHPYNTAWRNERTVEIPLARRAIEGCRDGRIIEIGNVLSHYLPVRHDILDKYETAPGVLNQDLAELDAEGRYDLAVCLSTIEHVGWYWYEPVAESGKVLDCWRRVKRALAPGGLALVTAPVGYNRAFDRYVAEGEIDFTEYHYLKRVSADNRWTEATETEARAARYNRPFPDANALLVGTWRR